MDFALQRLQRELEHRERQLAEEVVKATEDILGEALNLGYALALMRSPHDHSSLLVIYTKRFVENIY